MRENEGENEVEKEKERGENEGNTGFGREEIPLEEIFCTPPREKT